MIRNETEYQEASARLADERKRLTDHRAGCRRRGSLKRKLSEPSIQWNHSISSLKRKLKVMSD